MGATSVTGVGPGSAEGKDAGRKEYTVSVAALIGPRIMACETVTLSGSGGFTVILPALQTSTDGYGVVATDNTANNAVGAVMTFPTDAAGNAYTQIVLSGSANHVVTYMVLRHGLIV